MRDEKLDKHLTPADVARHQMDYGIGRTYATHGNVWDVDKDIVQVGLLQLILKSMEKSRKERLYAEDEFISKHRTWLSFHQGELLYLFDEHKKQCERLVRMFGPEANLGDDTWKGMYYFNPSNASEIFRADKNKYETMVEGLRLKVHRLQSVNCPEDVVNLYGIGKKKAEKILANIKKKEESSC